MENLVNKRKKKAVVNLKGNEYEIRQLFNFKIWKGDQPRHKILENLRKIGNRYKDEKVRKFALKTYIKFLIIGVDNLWKEMEEKIK